MCKEGAGAGSSGRGKGELLSPPKPNGKGERIETGEIFQVSISESAEPFLLGLAGIRGAASFDEVW